MTVSKFTFIAMLWMMLSVIRAASASISGEYSFFSTVEFEVQAKRNGKTKNAKEVSARVEKVLVIVSNLVVVKCVCTKKSKINYKYYQSIIHAPLLFLMLAQRIRNVL
jgi:hypothetical protein